MGELIHLSGTMSGGGAKRRGGGMSSKFVSDAVQPEVLRKYKQDHASVDAQLADVFKQLQAAGVQLDSITRSGPQIDVETARSNRAEGAHARTES